MGNRLDVERILGVHHADNWEKYVGLPCMVGWNKKWAFASLRDKIRSRISFWSTRLLSMGGRKEDCWVPRSLLGRVRTFRSGNIERVSELILPNGIGWNQDLIDLLFVAADAILIQGIYRLLLKRIVSCGAVNIRVMMGYPLHVVSAQMDFHEWLSWILNMYHITKHCEICVTLWAIWFARNRAVHEGTNQSVGEIVSFICSYCVKLVFVIPTNNGVVSGFQVLWSQPPIKVVKINVDTGFRFNQKRVVAGVVIRDENGKILGACCKITYPVLSVFVAEAIAVIHGL
ncbi:hypothetical protein PVK06_009552 [Gossypium arboreum]|uniref:RNase H type-1 domain-containing protein n=1 Tax=Gossypium arboreum TaxID=29729 RepID=A0ABR0QNR2_GOSAR|nr:hypothetical protein PVK06_009552 [Gossypium arboreum]